MIDEFFEPALYESNAIPYVEPFVDELTECDELSECDELADCNECSVCMGEHDEEIHAATVSVRGWFRVEVTKSFRIQPEVLIPEVLI